MKVWSCLICTIKSPIYYILVFNEFVCHSFSLEVPFSSPASKTFMNKDRFVLKVSGRFVLRIRSHLAPNQNCV